MKKILISLQLILVLSLLDCTPVMAQLVTKLEALTVATNWIAVIIAKKGSWGQSKIAEIEEIVNFSRNSRQVGYFCKVQPQGYIIVSLRREMAPVKAYSATSELDPLSEEGMADLLKGGMERVLMRIEQRERQQKGIIQEDAMQDNTLEIDYRPAWDALEESKVQIEKEVFDQTDTIESDTDKAGEKSNYQEGEVLLTSYWHQGPPYNNDCLDMSCSESSNGNVVVGCVATAAAQIMRYWNWPPYGSGVSTSGVETVNHVDPYDWINMPDETFTSSSTEQQAAVAELSHEIGVAVEMDYGCTGSGVPTEDMEAVYEEHYRYADVTKLDHIAFTATSWFAMLKLHLNGNMPLQYRIPGHSIVADGWQTLGIVNQYHMNYGWGGGATTWYTVDAISTNPAGEEYFIWNIRPAPYVSSLNGQFPRLQFPYRYVTMDTITECNGTFEGGQQIQFLPGVVMGCTSGSVFFENWLYSSTRMFTRGDLSNGIDIVQSEVNAGIKIYSGGGIKLY